MIDTTFAVEHDHFGQLIQHELMSGGSEMQVTNDNKDKYVRYNKLLVRGEKINEALTLTLSLFQ